MLYISKNGFSHKALSPFRKPVSQDENEWSIGQIYAEISTSQIRNTLIVDDVIKSVNEGRNPIVLTERTAHVEVKIKDWEGT